MIALATGLFFLFLYWNVGRHYRLWQQAQKWPSTEQRVPIDHDKEFVLRLVIFSPVALLFYRESLTGIGKLTLMPWLAAILGGIIIVAGMIMFTFWFLFNGFFNQKRDRAWFFEGTIDKNESKSDDFLRGKPVWQKLLIQLGGSLLFIGLYIWLCYKF